MYDLARHTNTQLTHQGMSTPPTCSVDGIRLLFGWQKSVRANVFQTPVDERAPMERVTTSECDQRVGASSFDGNTVALIENCRGRGSDISVLDARTGRVTPLLNSPSNEAFPAFSRDGHWLAYSSDESDSYEVYVQRFPGSGRYPISSAGGIQPLWSRDGRELFYRWQDQMWVVDVRTDGGFAAGKPRLLFERTGYARGAPTRGYDLSLDSQRFLMVKLEQRKPSPAT